MERWKAHMVRLPKPIEKRMARIIKRDSSTASQFLRTAAVEKLDRDEKLNRTT
jgi:predicted DNA-binding protein